MQDEGSFRPHWWITGLRLVVGSEQAVNLNFTEGGHGRSTEYRGTELRRAF